MQRHRGLKRKFNFLKCTAVKDRKVVGDFRAQLCIIMLAYHKDKKHYLALCSKTQNWFRVLRRKIEDIVLSDGTKAADIAQKHTFCRIRLGLGLGTGRMAGGMK